VPPADGWAAERATRRHEVAAGDQREAFQRDRDRILYCSAFRRLGGVTQIVRADEADVFHTRLAHTLKVAQVGRRLAEKLLREQPQEARELGLDPEVVEAACLAHDLGHPPFGHIGERLLNQLVRDAEDREGFEGNAQSFRIVTNLAVRFRECPGLDLTRATLAACVKYPWLADSDEAKRTEKWNGYSTEKTDFEFAREYWRGSGKTAEAELMDWADDIAYSVHDLEDFHRCGMIPWHKIFGPTGRELVVQSALNAWRNAPRNADGRLRKAYDRLRGLIDGLTDIVREPYEALRVQRQELRELTSQLIGRFVGTIHLRMPTRANDSCVEIDQSALDEVSVLKQLTRDYVLRTPSLAAQQKGQQKILGEMYRVANQLTYLGNFIISPNRMVCRVPGRRPTALRA
jgi:dGTPase